MSALIGTVETLMRYPVKSMQGASAKDVDVTSRGLTGDRSFALKDIETGKIASSKLPHRWRDIILCSGCVAADGEISVTLPDGTRLSGKDIDKGMSALLGRPVELISDFSEATELDRSDPDDVALEGIEKETRFETMAAAQGTPGGGFFDFAALHLISSASLEHLAATLGEDAADLRRYRPNLVVATPDGTAFQENSWAGQQLAIGPDLVIAVITASPRCAVPTLPQPGLAIRPTLTNDIGKLNKVEIMDMEELPCLGAYAAVVTPGKISVGDEVRRATT